MPITTLACIAIISVFSVGCFGLTFVGFLRTFD